MTEFSGDEFVERFRDRADAVRRRNLPPVEGEARKAFIEQSKLDFMDFAMLADATVTVDEGVITIRIDTRGGS